MYSLNDVPAVIEDSTDIFCIYCAGEVRITVMSTMLLSVSPRWLLRDLEEIVSYEVFGSSEFFVGSLVNFRLRFGWKHIVDKLREIFI